MSDNPGLTDLLGWWAMDEASGNRLDSHGSITFVDNNTCPSDNPVNWRGENSVYMLASNNEFLSYTGTGFKFGPTAQSFTIGMWIHPHALENDSLRIFGRWTDGSTPNQDWLIIHYNDMIRFYVTNAGGTQYWVEANNFGTLTNQNWYHVCVYYDVSAGRIGVGVNNVYNSTTSPGTGGITAGSGNTYFGVTASSGYNYSGRIDEAWCYKGRALTNAERTWMYNSGEGRRYVDVVADLIPSPPIELGHTIDSLTIQIYDTSLERIGVIDDYFSLTWAERYNSLGDFELEIPVPPGSDPGASFLPFGAFLYIKSSTILMVIEDQKLIVDEANAKVLISGKSVESILKRRSFKDPYNISGSAERAIYQLVEENITNTVEWQRTIDEFDSVFTAMLISNNIDEQIDAQNVYNAISNIAEVSDLGFKIICPEINNPQLSLRKLYFYVYEGLNRSEDQTENTRMVFSDKFENVLKSSYYNSEEGKITLARVFTNDTTFPQVDVWQSGWSEPSGIDRHEGILETEIDRDVSSPAMTDSEVYAVIQTRGRKLIKDSGPFSVVDGDFDIQLNFQYGEDFNMGDIVQFEVMYQSVTARVIELVRSYSAEGESAYLGLEFIDEFT